MTLSMHQASAPVVLQGLKGLTTVLEKSAAFCVAKKIDEKALLQARLFPDMFPFARQVQITTDQGKGMMARLAGQTPPAYEDTEASFEALIARVAKTKAFVEGIDPALIDGSEDRPVVLKNPAGEITFTGQAFLLNHALPNFFFHLTTSYDLMRHNGVELGKGNFLGR